MKRSFEDVMEGEEDVLDSSCSEGRVLGDGAAGRWCSGADVPFEFEGEIARACAVTEAGDVESRTAAAGRHDVCLAGV